MSNPQTAAEWLNVASTLEKELERVTTSSIGITQILAKSDSERQNLLAQRTSLNAIINNSQTSTSDRTAARKELLEVNKSLVKKQDEKKTIEIAYNESQQKIQTLNQQITNAKTQAENSLGGPTNFNSTTSPSTEFPSPNSAQTLPVTSVSSISNEDMIAASASTEANASSSARVASNTSEVTTRSNRSRSGAVAMRDVNTRGKDLRVRLSLAKNAQYFYKIARPGDILYPLYNTDGVIFPYTPQINTTYSAGYEPLDVTHSNYKIFNYKSSSVDQIQISCEFTAQDTTEANYLLAVMHFFKCVTKMFYGQDSNRGAPPPLCYLSGYGKFAFNEHPLVINSYTLNYPQDVDYINAGAELLQGQQLTIYNSPVTNQRAFRSRINALQRSGVGQGAISSKAPFRTVENFDNITRVPTKIQISISAYPIITRNAMSNTFSLAKYATGELLRNINGKGGIW